MVRRDDNNLYDRWFWWRRFKNYHEKEVRIAEELRQIFRPRSVYDAGCAIGSYLSHFHKCGIRVAGCDKYLDNGRGRILPEVAPFIEVRDLAVSQAWPGRYQLVLCIEVGEHLAHDDHAALFDNLRKLCARRRGRVFFTGDFPKSRKHYGHVGCRTLEDWIATAEMWGLRLCHDETRYTVDRLYRCGNLLSLARHALVFKRG